MNRIVIALVGLATICRSAYDPRYASVEFGRTLSPIMEYGGDCSKYCLDSRPGNIDGWKKGTYSCGDATRKFWKCTCMQCQRDCVLDEVMADRRCIIAPFIPPKFDVAGKIMGSIGKLFKALPIDFGEFADNVENPFGKKILDIADKIHDGFTEDESAPAPATDDALPAPSDGGEESTSGVDSPWIGGAIEFAKDIFSGADKVMEMDELAAAIAIDINRRTEQLIQCMDAKIAAFQNKIYDWSVKEALSSYEIAAMTDDADIENKADKVHDAWADHVNVIRSKFVSSDDPLFVYTLLQSGTIYNLLTTFSLISTDYLTYLANSKSSNFDARYETTIDCYDMILNYVSTSKDYIAASYKANLMAMPCRNGYSLDKEISKWEDGFYPVYYEPIELFKTAMEEFKTNLPDNFYEKLADLPEEEFVEFIKDTAVEESEPALLRMSARVVVEDEDDGCSVPVLSVDHKWDGRWSPKGKYFNFDKNALDAALGRRDWNGERIILPPKGARFDVLEVIVWRSASGGSVGDAHGRRYDLPEEGDWSIGDKLQFC